jgi:DNA uptake protein ComE-like DNA-binding protein
MYRYDWELLLTPDLMSRISTAAGVADEAVLDRARPALAASLAAASGLPVIERQPDRATLTRLGTDLLHDAIRHLLADIAGPRNGSAAPAGTAQAPGQGPLASVAKAVARPPVNQADAATIATACDISPVLAERIVQERRTGGPFASAESLDQRVRGIGPVMRDRLAATLSFDDAADRRRAMATISHDFDADLARLVSLQAGATPAERLVAAFESMATVCAASPHPATTAQRRRAPMPAAAAQGHPTDWIGVLANQDYYGAIIDLFDAAMSSIDVCMFHVACPGEEHPTHRILQALADASARSVAVRVLIDRDRQQDPYKSTLINTPARRLLEEAGVPVRMDRANRLLHSKFVVIDAATVVLGSHNWSAGSYFDFDDLTLVLASKPLATELRQRFEGLWKTGR